MSELQELKSRLDQAEATIQQLRSENGGGAGGQQINAIYRQPKIANFCRENPTTWFVQAEITLRNAGITTSATKADFIAEKLDLEALQAIQSIITQEPRPADIYDKVKEKLISTFGSSGESRLRQLIKGQVSTCGKPSLTLNRLRGLGTGCSDEVLRTVFLDQLPGPCRAALSVCTVETLDKLATMADKYFEATETDRSQVAAVAKESRAPDCYKEDLARILAEISDLKTRVNRLSQSRSRSKSRQSGNQQNKNIAPSNSADQKPQLCRLHKKYGANARKCFAPCAWKPQGS